MKNAFKTLFNFIHGNPDEQDRNAAAFLAKSENFRLLLSANNEALELMSEMTGESRSDKAFGISHVRAQSFKVASGVRQMIERLCLMAPGKYEGLRDVFNAILMSMDRSFQGRAAAPCGPVVLDMEDVRAASLPETGSKVALLGEIRAALGVEVPRGFVLTVSAFRAFMHNGGLEDEIGRLIQIHHGDSLTELAGLEKSIRNAIDIAQIPPEIEKMVKDRCGRFGSIRFAVRSSALDEDSEQAGFAGQFKSVLGVAPADLLEAYRVVLASLYSATAMTYIRNRGLREDEMVMAVGCMEMVDAVAGGVVYSRSPMGADDSVVISAVSGLPCAVVDGSSGVDSWVVDRNTLAVTSRELAEKEVRFVLASGGRVRKERLYGERSTASAISDDVAKRLAALAVLLEEYFFGPQDIEWALTRNGRIVILQTRPLSLCGTAPEAASDVDESRHLALLSGCVPASPGAASGYVVAVDTDEDMFRFPDGAILLARNARPKLSALLPKAAALVAEFGSAVGHLANVAREYGIPALIGAPGAVERLSGVGLVTVNGTTGKVYLGHRQKQIDKAGKSAPKPRLTDVGVALRNVLVYIAPLNLIDPESPDFRPEGCKTLHDITRYCHEKAVVEMFTTGRRPVSSARRLIGKSAMQYWLVDLGGGTAETGTGKTIGIEDVQSNAMRALWHGMMAVPWEGPPPVNVDGFLSVLGNAAMNPALAPGALNDMGERNYFIVGRNYCNLQSRFGFHFCTIEGFAGDDPGANYALFQFKGGGADMDRRHTRAQLVGEVLDRHGFIVEIKEDALFARLEGVSREAAEEAMAILGYLLMHTRQIDMSMADMQAVARYRNKFETDIGTVLSGLSVEQALPGCEA